MPLLSLPSELLAEIIREALVPPTSATASCCDPEVDLTRSCIPRNTTNLAHTCQRLRSLTLPFMYASVMARPNLTPALHALLASHPHIAGYVRQLTLFPTDARNAELLQNILTRCTRLQGLRLDVSGTTEEATTTLLAHLPRPLIALTLRSPTGYMILPYLSLVPHSIHTVLIEGHIDINFIGSAIATGPAPDLPALGDLPQVSMLIYRTNSCNLPTLPDTGEWLAQTMQNVHVLDAHITRDSLSLLKCYGNLGSRLRELTVHFRWVPAHICKTLALLAPSLRKFVAHGGVVCHDLFDADWGCVEEFEVVCDGGCDDVKVEVLREALVRLVCARPAAKVRVMVRGEHDLVWCSGGVGEVGSVEMFSVLEEEEWECTFGRLD